MPSHAYNARQISLPADKRLILSPAKPQPPLNRYDWTRTVGVDGIHVLALFTEPALDHTNVSWTDLLAIGAQVFLNQKAHQGFTPAHPHAPG